MKFGKMKTQRQQRLVFIALMVLGMGTALGIALLALNENINLFYAPEQIVRGEAPNHQVIRAGGMVKIGSVRRSKTDLKVSFIISDLKQAEVEVHYKGILPDLFREGQGIIARGWLDHRGVFNAEEVLAKHDENYMPPEVSEMLTKTHQQTTQRPNQGRWGSG